MRNGRQEWMEGLLPSNSWEGSGGHGASVLAIDCPPIHPALFALDGGLPDLHLHFLRCCVAHPPPNPPRVPSSEYVCPLPPLVGRRRRRRPSRISKGQPDGWDGGWFRVAPACLGRYPSSHFHSHFAISRVNPGVFEESSARAREVREGRPLPSPAPGPAALFQLCSALSLARRQPALLCWFLTSACVRLAAGFLLRPRFARFSPSQAQRQ